jgi:hypothetical protein
MIIMIDQKSRLNRPRIVCKQQNYSRTVSSKVMQDFKNNPAGKTILERLLS